jgi:hypothetical protein
MEAVLTFHQGFDGHLFIDGKGKLLLSYFGIGKANYIDRKAQETNIAQ